MKWQYVFIAAILLVGTASATLPDIRNMSMLHFTSYNGTQYAYDMNGSIQWTFRTASGYPYITNNWSPFVNGSLKVGIDKSGVTQNYINTTSVNPMWTNLSWDNQSYTISGWLNWTGNTGGVSSVFAYAGSGQGDTTYSNLMFGQTGIHSPKAFTPYIRYTTNFCDARVLAPAAIDADGWHHFLFEKNGTANNLSFYWDGALITRAENAVGGCSAWSSFTYVGAGNAVGQPMAGTIDEFVIENGTALSPYTVPVRQPQYGGTDDPRIAMQSNISISLTFPIVANVSDTSAYTYFIPNSWSYFVNSSPTAGTWYNLTGYPPSDNYSNVTVTLTAPGVLAVNLTAGNTTSALGYNYTSLSSKYIFGNTTPVSDFNGTPRYTHPYTAVNFVDMSTGAGIYAWNYSFGDKNVSALRNPYNTYGMLGNYDVNLTVMGLDGVGITVKTNYIRVNWNNTFTLIVRDADTFNLITTPDIIKLSQLGVDYTQQYTSGGVATFELPDGTYDVMASAIPGEYQSNIASVTMAGTDASGTIYLTPVSSGTKTTWYTQKQIQLNVVDAYRNGLPGVNITANYISSSFPNTSVSWITSAFGVSSTVASEMTNNGVAMTGISDQQGSATFMFFPGIKYGLTITNASIGLSHYTTLSPQDSSYTILCPLPSQSSKTSTAVQLVNSTLWISEPNMSYVTFNLRYHDEQDLTTYLVWNITQWSNKTWMYTKDFGNVGGSIILDNYTVPNVRGQEWRFWYNATRTIA